MSLPVAIRSPYVQLDLSLKATPGIYIMLFQGVKTHSKIGPPDRVVIVVALVAEGAELEKSPEGRARLKRNARSPTPYRLEQIDYTRRLERHRSSVFARPSTVANGRPRGHFRGPPCPRFFPRSAPRSSVGANRRRTVANGRPRDHPQPCERLLVCKIIQVPLGRLRCRQHFLRAPCFFLAAGPSRRRGCSFVPLASQWGPLALVSPLE